METIEVLQKYPNCQVKYTLPNDDKQFKSWGHNIDYSQTMATVLITAGETTAYHLIDEDIRLPIENITPILRPMSSMTDSEKKELWSDFDTIKETIEAEMSDEDIISGIKNLADYLRSISIDIDNLIEQGIAEAQQ